MKGLHEEKGSLPALSIKHTQDAVEGIEESLEMEKKHLKF